MVAPVFYPATLFVPSACPPEWREYLVRPPIAGEQCFAVVFYSPPRRSTWRPRTVDSVPPMHKGKRKVFYHSFDRARVVKDCAEFNAGQLRRQLPGRSVGMWALAVSIVCGFPETAQLLAEGGAL